MRDYKYCEIVTHNVIWNSYGLSGTNEKIILPSITLSPEISDCHVSWYQ